MSSCQTFSNVLTNASKKTFAAPSASAQTRQRAAAELSGLLPAEIDTNTQSMATVESRTAHVRAAKPQPPTFEGPRQLSVDHPVIPPNSVA